MTEACPNLELSSVYGVGCDAVDLAAARERGVRMPTNDVADLGVAMMLCHSRGMIGAERWLRDGNWARGRLYPLKRRVWGRKAGVLGLGRIGFELATRLDGFGIEIAYSDAAANKAMGQLQRDNLNANFSGNRLLSPVL